MIAIGGVGAAQIADILQTGAHGVAVIRAVALAPDPRQAAATLRTEIQAALSPGAAE